MDPNEGCKLTSVKVILCILFHAGGRAESERGHCVALMRLRLFFLRCFMQGVVLSPKEGLVWPLTKLKFSFSVVSCRGLC